MVSGLSKSTSPDSPTQQQETSTESVVASSSSASPGKAQPATSDAMSAASPSQASTQAAAQTSATSTSSQVAIMPSQSAVGSISSQPSSALSGLFTQGQITVQPQQMHPTAVSHIIAASVQGQPIQTQGGQMTTHPASMGHQIGMSMPQQPIQVISGPNGYQFPIYAQNQQMLFQNGGNLTLQPYPNQNISLQLPTHATGISMANAHNNKLPIGSKCVSMSPFGQGTNLIHTGKAGTGQSIQVIRPHMSQINQPFAANGNSFLISTGPMQPHQTSILPSNNKTLIEQKGKSYQIQPKTTSIMPAVSNASMIGHYKPQIGVPQFIQSNIVNPHQQFFGQMYAPQQFLMSSHQPFGQNVVIRGTQPTDMQFIQASNQLQQLPMGLSVTPNAGTAIHVAPQPTVVVPSSVQSSTPSSSAISSTTTVTQSVNPQPAATASVTSASNTTPTLGPKLKQLRPASSSAGTQTLTGANQPNKGGLVNSADGKGSAAVVKPVVAHKTPQPAVSKQPGVSATTQTNALQKKQPERSAANPAPIQPKAAVARTNQEIAKPPKNDSVATSKIATPEMRSSGTTLGNGRAEKVVSSSKSSRGQSQTQSDQSSCVGSPKLPQRIPDGKPPIRKNVEKRDASTEQDPEMLKNYQAVVNKGSTTTNSSQRNGISEPLVDTEPRPKPRIMKHVINGFVIEESSHPFPVNEDLVVNGNGNHNNENAVVNKLGGVNGINGLNGVATPPLLKKSATEALCEHCGRILITSHSKQTRKRGEKTCRGNCQKNPKAPPLGLFNPVTANLSDYELNNSGADNNSVSSMETDRASEESDHLDQRKRLRDSRLAEEPPVVSAKVAKRNEPAPVPVAAVPMEVSVPAPVVKDTAGAKADEDSSGPNSVAGVYVPAGGSYPQKWSVVDVYDFIRHLPGCQEYADEFRSQEIDGQALMLLKEDHLMSAMGMKLGPALKVCSKINALRERAEASKIT